jgi:hypothetical protein
LQWSQWISGTEIVSVTITQAPHMSEALQGLASYPLGVSAASQSAGLAQAITTLCRYRSGQ